MKAIRVLEFGEPQVMHIEQVQDPQPDNHEVVVEVKAAGVNPVDTYIRAGAYSFGEVPYTPGIDAAGIVADVGANVTKVSVGDRVYVFGSQSRVPRYDSQCHRPFLMCFPQIQFW